MSKPNKDGWIRHRGKMQPPVEPGTIIDVRYRNGDIDEASEVGEDEEWLHEGSPYDVMAWRPHKPAYTDFQPAPMIEAPKKPDALVLDYSPSLHIQSFGRAYRAEGDPRGMRDRIREIDAATIALNEERASLVAKLKAEGFALIQSDEPNSELEPSQQGIAQQDMSDWRNWKEGDLVSAQSNSIGGYGDHFSKGDLYPVTAVDTDDPACPIEVDALWFRANELHQIKWHSRPTN